MYLAVGFIVIIDFVNKNWLLLSSEADDSQIPVRADRVKKANCHVSLDKHLSQTPFNIIYRYGIVNGLNLRL